MTVESARIFDIQRFSIHDGPGIRTTVFFKGCPLRCLWCHNPESQTGGASLSFSPELCIGCGACLAACPSGARDPAHSPQATPAGGGDDATTASPGPDSSKLSELAEGAAGAGFDRSRCRVCGNCAAVCPGGALEIVGRDAPLREIMDTVLRDRPFYETSGGGLTISGGEPLAQCDAAEGLLQLARGEGLHTVVDTSGYAAWECFERLLPLVDMFLYDIKEMDPVRHGQLTGVGNELILDNLHRLHDAGAVVRVRLPLIQGCNDNAEHFAALARLAGSLPHLAGFDLLAYHPLGRSKWRRFGLQEPDAPMPGLAADEETVATWRKTLIDLGLPLSG